MSLYKLQNKTWNIQIRHMETAMEDVDSVEDDYLDSVEIMTSKPSTSSSNSNKLKKNPINLRNVQQEQKTFIEESFSESENPDSHPWIAEDRYHRWNKILEWPKSPEKKENRKSERMPFVLASQRWYKLQKAKEQKKQKEVKQRKKALKWATKGAKKYYKEVKKGEQRRKEGLKKA